MDCPSCGTSNPPQARFCLSCGSALAAADASPRREERKVVSILFADLVGFTARAEQLDPEDVEQILRPYHERLRTDIERFGGIVEKFIGDAVMAVFGAPTAHEDDAERAVRAALAIRDWAREHGAIELRIGVNTGEALVNVDARPERGDSMVKGDVVNTAARLQAAAPVNGIVVGEATYRATSSVFDYALAEPVTAKGKAEPIPAWEPQQARARFGVDVRQVGRSPFVGRQPELHALVSALARARAAREPQLVTLVAVPGMGKSRLVWELFQHVDADKEIHIWRQGRSLPYGEGVSFWALGEMVKGQAGILESDDPEAARSKLEVSVIELVGDATQRDWVSGHLRPLIGLGGASELVADRGEAFAAWRRYLEALAEQHPLILVFEDLHWADDGTLDFVDHLADWAAGVPLLIVATARPELLTRRTGWGGGKSNAVTLSLAPLSDDETAQMLHSLLDTPVLTADAQQALLEKAAGNPLYAEEFVRLAQEGRGDAPMPESVQAIIAARLDTLEPDDKRLIQQAAVLGKVFWLGGLADIAERSRWAVEETLHRLERREFVRRERNSSVAAETEYAFRHALIRDTAYEQLPRAERAANHQRVARWLESLGRPEDTAEMLGHHYLAAIEFTRAAGQAVEQLVTAARPALVAAGERALALSAMPAARSFFSTTLELTPEDDPGRPVLLLRYGQATFGWDFELARQALMTASEGLAEAGDRELGAEAEVLLAQLHWHKGERRGADEHLARAEELIAGAGPTASRARVLATLSRFHMLAHRNEQAISLGQEAIGLARQLQLTEVEAQALNNVGSAHFYALDDSGIAELERGLELALAINSIEAARAYNNLAATVALMGDLKRSHRLRQLAVETDRKLGGAAIGRFAEGATILDTFLLGRWDEFVERAQQFTAQSERRGRHYQELYFGSIRGVIDLARGDSDRALASAEGSAEWGREVGEPQSVVPTLALLAHIQYELDMPAAAAQMLDEIELRSPRTLYLDWLVPAMVSAPDQASRRRFERFVHPGTTSKLGAVTYHLAEGRMVDAAQLLEDGGWLTYAAMVRTLAARELAAAGRQADADTQLRLALKFWREVRATRYISRAEALLSKAG